MLYRLAYVFVLITGLTGLVYQVTWHQYLSFYLGSHAMAAALVLAVFFLFLSLGYAVLGRNIHRIRIQNKLFVYGIIEALIGLYALLSPPLFHLLVQFLPAGGESQTGDFILGLLFTTAYIGIPTFLMGTTIPVLTEALARNFETSHGTHAAVYGLNTLGAVFGALLTGFVLIEAWGLPLTLLNTGMLNILVGFATYLIWKARPHAFAGIATAPSPPTGPAAAQAEGGPRSRGWVLLLLGVSFASGFYVFSLENLMIRVAGLVIGSSGYTFAMIVAAFILGIALGSLWVGRRRVTSPRFFLGVQLALLVSAIGLYLLVPILPEWFARIRVLIAPAYLNIPYYWTAVFALFALILLVPVALMGMNLPLIFSYLRSRGLFLSQTVGRIYAVNTLGSVLGSLIGGYLLFYWLTWDGVFRFNLVLIALTLPFIVVMAGLGRRRAVVAGVVPLVVIFTLPQWDDHAFLPGAASISRAAQTQTSLQPSLERLREGASLDFTYHGPSAHVGVVRRDGGPSLHINGNPNTGDEDWELRAMNAIYPLSFVQAPQSAFVVGLGGGLSTSIFAEMPSIDRVLVAEIAIGAIKALPYFDEQNADFTTQPYYDKAEFIAADAIKVLRSTDETFDIIVSEPNHPWVAGVENLFSVEFLTLVRDRLDEDGVYCQWFPLFVSEPGIVLTILNTFNEVFPHVRAFSTGGGTLSIVASRKPLQADINHIEDLLNRLDHRLTPRESDFTDPHFLLATEVLNEWALATAVEDFSATHTFEFPVVSASASRARFAAIGTTLTESVMDRLHRLPPEQDVAGRMLLEDLRGKMQAEDFDRIQQKIAVRGEIARLILPRLWHQRSTWFETQPEWPAEEQRQLLAYVSGLSDQAPERLRNAESAEVPDWRREEEAALIQSPDAGPEPALQSAGLAPTPKTGDESQRLRPAYSLFSIYRQLIRAHVPADLGRVVAEVPVECKNTGCFALKKAVLVTSDEPGIQPNNVNTLDPEQPEDRQRIEAAFEVLRQSQRPLEAG